MKLKKLLDVMFISQSIRIIAVDGIVTQRSQLLRLSDKFDRPLLESLEKYKVHSLRCVHDELATPENQDYIEITLIGGNDND